MMKYPVKDRLLIDKDESQDAGKEVHENVKDFLSRSFSLIGLGVIFVFSIFSDEEMFEAGIKVV